MGIVNCDGTGGTVDATINHNLGQNQAAYAIISLELNDFLAGWDSGTSVYDTLSIDLRMRGINSGYEQLFIITESTIIPPPPTVVPEPSTIILLLTGLFTLGLYQCRKKKTRM